MKLIKVTKLNKTYASFWKEEVLINPDNICLIGKVVQEGWIQKFDDIKTEIRFVNEERIFTSHDLFELKKLIEVI